MKGIANVYVICKNTYRDAFTDIATFYEKNENPFIKMLEMYKIYVAVI